MSSGGGGGGPTSSNVYQSSLPAYAKPYYEQVMGQASAAAQLPYQTYGGDLVAGMNQNQTNALQGYYGQQDSAGTNYMTQAGNLANTAAQTGYNPSQVAAGTVNAGTVNAGQTGTSTFDNNAAQQYMNPYAQQVIDAQKTQAIHDYGQQQVANNNSMAANGAFGGTRQAVINAEGQRNLNSSLQNIQSTGLNTAYNNAQQQFNTDQSRDLQSQQGNVQSSLQAALANQGAGLQGQQFNVQQNLAAQQANQQAGLNAAQLNSNNALQGAATLGSIGSTLNSQAQSALQGISGIGNQQQQTEQQGLTAGYNNFLNQTYWPQNQISWYSNILHGTPVTPNSQQTSLAPNSSIAGQLTGLGALGLGAASTKTA